MVEFFFFKSTMKNFFKKCARIWKKNRHLPLAYGMCYCNQFRHGKWMRIWNESWVETNLPSLASEKARITAEYCEQWRIVTNSTNKWINNEIKIELAVSNRKWNAVSLEQRKPYMSLYGNRRTTLSSWRIHTCAYIVILRSCGINIFEKSSGCDCYEDVDKFL